MTMVLSSMNKTKSCPVDSEGDLLDPNNLFFCQEQEECCTVDLQPACCAHRELEEEIWAQVELWLPVLVVILALAIFIWCCRTDESCFDVEKPLLYRCGCKNMDEDDDDQASIVDLKSSRLSLQSKSTTVVMEDDDGGHDARELQAAAERLDQVLNDQGLNVVPNV